MLSKGRGVLEVLNYGDGQMTLFGRARVNDPSLGAKYATVGILSTLVFKGLVGHMSLAPRRSEA